LIDWILQATSAIRCKQEYGAGPLFEEARPVVNAAAADYRYAV